MTIRPSFPDVQLHIGDAPLGAGPESILPIVVMDSGLAPSKSAVADLDTNFAELG
jgi:predicted dienelactone hydrolase